MTLVGEGSEPSCPTHIGDAPGVEDDFTELVLHLVLADLLEPGLVDVQHHEGVQRGIEATALLFRVAKLHHGLRNLLD